MRISQKTMFWKHHKIIEIKHKGKVVAWFGIRNPPKKEEVMKR